MGKTIENSSVDWREVDSNPRNYALNRMWSGRGQGESQSRFFRASSGLFLNVLFTIVPSNHSLRTYCGRAWQDL